MHHEISVKPEVAFVHGKGNWLFLDQLISPPILARKAILMC